MTFHRSNLCVALILAAGFFTGCKDKDAVKVYRVSKGGPESSAPQASGPASGGMGAPAVPGAPSAQPSQVTGTAPANWEPQPLTSMRQASFLVKGDNGETADISVSVFGGGGGGDLRNVNRWRAQVGLGEIGDGELKSLIVPVKCKDGEILTVDMAGPKGRILAGWARIDGKSWFFKLIAPDQLAAGEKAGFVKFLGSVQFHP